MIDVKIKAINRNNYYNLYLTMTEKSKTISYVEKLTNVSTGQFDIKEKKIVKHHNAKQLNHYIQKKINDLNDLIFKLDALGKTPNPEEIKEIFLNKTPLSGSFIDYAHEKIKLESGIKAEKTIAGYRQSIEKLARWKPGFSFDDLTFENMMKFQKWLSTHSTRPMSAAEKKAGYYLKERGHGVNARYQVFAAIRKYNNMAIAENKTKLFPFKTFKFKSEEGQKEFLTENQVDLLYDLWPSLDENDKYRGGFRLKKTLAYFLFSCDTGVSADDHHKKKFIFTETHIYFNRGKTNQAVSVRIPNRALDLLPFIRKYSLKKSHYRITKDLTEAVAMIGFNITPTFHTARNTFAVTALHRGVSLKAVQMILGQASSKTTEIYARVANDYADMEMEKMNKKSSIHK